jgi:F0F1-type ATP synthase assembly protein I
MKPPKDSPAATLLKANHTGMIFGMMLQIAVVSGVLVGAAVLLGILLDKVLATGSLFKFALTVIAAPVSLLVAYWLGMRTANKSKEADQAAAEIKKLLENAGKPAVESAPAPGAPENDAPDASK